jgi:hypothetical protein
MVITGQVYTTHRFYYLNILIISLLFLGTSCQKAHQYPEDDIKTRRSPDKRLSGKWQLTDYQKNQSSIISEINQLYTGHIKDVITNVTFYYEYNDYDQWIFSLNTGLPRFSAMGVLAEVDYFKLGPFSNEDTLLNKVLITPFTFEPGKIGKWKIMKLYDKDFIISQDYNGNNYRIEFKKIPF